VGLEKAVYRLLQPCMLGTLADITRSAHQRRRRYYSLLLTKLCDIEADIGTEINSTPPDGLANVLETWSGIGATVSENDEPTTAPLSSLLSSGDLLPGDSRALPRIMLLYS
jgi:hypothetical protein